MKLFERLKEAWGRERQRLSLQGKEELLHLIVQVEPLEERVERYREALNRIRGLLANEDLGEVELEVKIANVARAALAEAQRTGEADR